MAHDAMLLSGSTVFRIALLAAGVALLLAAAWHDVAARIIPNWAPLGIAGLGLVLRAAQGQLAGGVLLGLIVFAAAAACWSRGWMGGGDVKLLAATAIFIPPLHIPELLAAVTLAGGAIALFYLAAKRLLARLSRALPPRPRRLPGRVLRVERWRLLRGGSLPYASAIAAGTLFVLVTG